VGGPGRFDSRVLFERTLVTAVAIVLAGILLAVVGAVLTIRLALRVWRNRERASFMAKLVVLFVVAAATFGAVGTLVGMIKAFGAIGGESVDPSQKARILAEGISEAMNCAAFGLVLWLPSVIAAFALTSRTDKSPPNAGN
jgi:biopolymer transport protein ExbB/TolQ